MSANKTTPAADEKPKEPSSSFYRGYFFAEQRKPIVEHEPGLGQMIFSGMFSAIPVVFLYWMYTRSQTAAAKASQEMTKKGGTMQKFMADMQRMMNGGIENRNFRVEIKGTSFTDVKGVPEAVAEVKQYVDFLKEPERFTRLGARLPKGCLLTGDPGTGKTLLARAVAGEATVPFFTCSGADFIEVYSGSGPKRVRELFKEAKAAAPSVIFIDEIDAVGARGGKGGAGGGSSGEENRTVNQLLAEMDGLLASDLVVIFAATNHPDNIDKALLREGRFDRKVELPMPDIDAREELFTFALNKVITGDPKGLLTPPKVEFKNNNEQKQPGATTTPTTGAAPHTPSTPQQPPLPTTQQVMEAAVEAPVESDPSVSNAAMAKRLAALTPGVSPATVMTIVNEAALAAAVTGAKYVRLDNLLPAIDDVLIGKKHRSRMSEEASRRVALHEAGHTLVAWFLPQQSDVIKVSITPRGQAGGFTQQVGRERLDMQTDVAMFTDICVMLSGRIAESTRYTNLTSGAYDDLQRATKTAITKFLALGMSARVGLLAFDHNRIDNGRMYQHCSEQTQAAAEREAHLLIGAAFEYTTTLVKEKKDLLHKLADKLIEKREVLQEDIEAILGKRNTDVASLDPRVRQALSQFVKGAEVAGARDGATKAVENIRKHARSDEVDPALNVTNEDTIENKKVKNLPRGADVDQAMA
jgi:AFG3 family protein